MSEIKQYLEDYLKVDHSNDKSWNDFITKQESLIDKTRANLKKCFNFLPTNQFLSFHDATIVGGVNPNVNTDSFNITFRMLGHEKVEVKSNEHAYREIDPIYVKFSFDNKHRKVFHKLAVKCDPVLSVVYDDKNLGIIYLNKDYKEKALFIEDIDLSKNQVVDKPLNKKNKIQ